MNVSAHEPAAVARSRMIAVEQGVADRRAVGRKSAGCAKSAPTATSAKRMAGALFSLPVRFLLGLISAYQKTLSPALPALFGPGCGCRFYPTCSHYAAEALRSHGVIVGLALGAWRLLRCTPFTRGGYDPVPARGALRRACHRVLPRHETP